MFEPSSRPVVAVCMAVYNGRHHIEEQTESILSQDEVAVTLYASIDRSTDGSGQLLSRLAEQDTRVKLLPSIAPSGGAASNFFRLIADSDFSDHDFVALADQDDIWNSNKLIRACRALDGGDAGGYSSNVTAFWSDGREKLIDKAQPEREWDHLFESRGPGCTFVLKKSLALELQLFVRANRESLKQVDLHDWFIYAFARCRGVKWKIDAEPSMRYRQHQSNEVGVNLGWRAAAWRIRKTLSGWLIDQARLIASLAGASEKEFPASTLFAGRSGLLKLALNARKCRRKSRDQIFFAFSCLILALRGKTKSKS